METIQNFLKIRINCRIVGPQNLKGLGELALWQVPRRSKGKKIDFSSFWTPIQIIFRFWHCIEYTIVGYGQPTILLGPKWYGMVHIYLSLEQVPRRTTQKNKIFSLS